MKISSLEIGPSLNTVNPSLLSIFITVDESSSAPHFISIILSTAESICIENDIPFLSFWENSEMNKTTLKSISTKNGYLADNSHCFFGCKQLTTNNMLYEQKKNFFVTMADSDVF